MLVLSSALAQPEDHQVVCLEGATGDVMEFSAPIGVATHVGGRWRVRLDAAAVQDGTVPSAPRPEEPEAPALTRTTVYLFGGDEPIALSLMVTPATADGEAVYELEFDEAEEGDAPGRSGDAPRGPAASRRGSGADGRRSLPRRS